MTLTVTTASLPVLRGPVQLAKTPAALDILSGGCLVAGVGPGSSPGDYAAAGIGFPERWRRFDEALKVLRVLPRDDGAGFEGEFYFTRDVAAEPRPPVQRPGPLIWVASQLAGRAAAGRAPGRGMARVGLQHHPGATREGLERLAEERRHAGKATASFPSATTTWLYITEDKDAAERTLTGVLAAMLHRPLSSCVPLRC